MKHTILLALAMVGLLGCAGPKMVWYQPGKTAEEVRRDRATCVMQSQMGGGGAGWNPGSALAFAIADGSRRDSIRENCMISLGYTLVPVNSIPTNAPRAAK